MTRSASAMEDDMPKDGKLDHAAAKAWAENYVRLIGTTDRAAKLINVAMAYLDLHRAMPAATAGEALRVETGWLIEASDSPVSRPRYWTGLGSNHWSEDHNEAIRFARKRDAELMASGHGWEYRICEQGWDDGRAALHPAGAAAGEKNDAAKLSEALHKLISAICVGDGGHMDGPLRDALDNAVDALALHPAAAQLSASSLPTMETPMDRKTFQDRFIAWPVPETACADLCATTQQKGRSGTNFFTHAEAGELFDYLFPAAAQEEGEDAEKLTAVINEVPLLGNVGQRRSMRDDVVKAVLAAFHITRRPSTRGGQ